MRKHSWSYSGLLYVRLTTFQNLRFQSWGLRIVFCVEVLHPVLSIVAYHTYAPVRGNNQWMETVSVSHTTRNQNDAPICDKNAPILQNRRVGANTYNQFLLWMYLFMVRIGIFCHRAMLVRTVCHPDLLTRGVAPEVAGSKSMSFCVAVLLTQASQCGGLTGPDFLRGSEVWGGAACCRAPH